MYYSSIRMRKTNWGNRYVAVIPTVYYPNTIQNPLICTLLSSQSSILFLLHYQACLCQCKSSEQTSRRYSEFQIGVPVILQSVLVFLWHSRGRAIAQAVSLWLPTAAARVRARILSCGICGRQSGAGAGFLRVLRFPLPIFIPPIAPQSPSSIIWGLYNTPEVAAVPSGLSPTPLIIKKNNNMTF
jgi:hypothetical protein